MRKLILLLTTLLLAGCTVGGPGKKEEPNILGTWVDATGVYYSFQSDGTGEVGDHIEGEPITWWAIDGDSLFILVGLQPDTLRYKIKLQTERTLVFNNTFKFRKR